jgi:hypothetical protein
MQPITPIRLVNKLRFNVIDFQINGLLIRRLWTREVQTFPRLYVIATTVLC